MTREVAQMFLSPKNIERNMYKNGSISNFKADKLKRKMQRQKEKDDGKITEMTIVTGGRGARET